MKILLLSLGLLLMAAISTVYASDQDLMVADDNQTTVVNESALSFALAGEPTGELTAPEKEGLLYMVEEEKLAADVYSALFEKWDLRVFDNIGRAELTHEAAVQTLLERYSLTNPKKSAGEFSNATLQRLYDGLV